MNIIEKQLERADEAADKTWKEMYQPDKKEGEPPVVTQEDIPAAEPESAEPLEGKHTEEPPEPKKKEVDFEQKYKTLEGKYKAELPRALSERDKEKARAADLEAKIAKLQEDISKSKTVESDIEVDAELEEIAIDNPSLAKVLRKLKEGTDSKINLFRDELQTGVKSELETVKSDLVSTKLDRFDSDMKERGIPDWKILDTDPKFVEWLNEKVPYTKSTKLELIQAAAKQRDAETVSEFFLDYKKTLAGSSDDAPKPDAPAGDQNKMDKFTAPPKGKGGTAPNLPGEQTGLTRASYTKFMDETAHGKFNSAKWGGKTEEQMEVIFDNAIASGKLL